MNRNLKEELDEKNIRKLFGEMRRRDEQTAPSFSAVSQIPSNAENSVRISRLITIAAAAVIRRLIRTEFSAFDGICETAENDGAVCSSRRRISPNNFRMFFSSNSSFKFRFIEHLRFHQPLPNLFFTTV